MRRDCVVACCTSGLPPSFSRRSRDEGLFVIAVVELNFALFFPENSEHESNVHLFITEREETRREEKSGAWSSVCAALCPLILTSSSDYP